MMIGGNRRQKDTVPGICVRKASLTAVLKEVYFITCLPDMNYSYDSRRHWSSEISRREQNARRAVITGV